MYANSFQSGFISIFYSIGSNPLHQWDKAVKNGHIRRVIDDEVKSLVLEISGTNVATTYITCPIKPRNSLGIRLPFLVMVVKNMKKYFTFEIQILDDKDMRRRFRVSNFQSSTKVRPFCTTMPIGLSNGWNQIQFNLADFTRRAYGTIYIETVRVQVHANVRIRRLYFSDRLYSEEDLPSEYKLFLPVSSSQPKKPKITSKDKLILKSSKGVGDQKVQDVPKETPAAPPSPADNLDEIRSEHSRHGSLEEKASQDAVIDDVVATDKVATDDVVTDVPENIVDEDIAPREENVEKQEEGYETDPVTDDELFANDLAPDVVEGYDTDVTDVLIEEEGEGVAPPPSEI